LLFQASAQEMVDAYSNVPRPHGNVIALEVFQSGIIMSEYVNYLNQVFSVELKYHPVR
jgi:hypothetical protein